MASRSSVSSKRQCTLKAWKSGDPETAKMVVSERHGLKIIAETQEQRTFRSRLESYFSQNVNKDGVCEYLLISVARIVHQLGSLLQATWVYTSLLLSSVIAHSNWILCEL